MAQNLVSLRLRTAPMDAGRRTQTNLSNKQPPACGCILARCVAWGVQGQLCLGLADGTQNCCERDRGRRYVGFSGHVQLRKRKPLRTPCLRAARNLCDQSKPMALGLHHPCQIAGHGLVTVHDGCEAADEIARDADLVAQFRRGEEVLVVHPQICASGDLETRESHGLHVLLQESLGAPTVSPNECVERGRHTFIVQGRAAIAVMAIHCLARMRCHPRTTSLFGYNVGSIGLVCRGLATSSRHRRCQEVEADDGGSPEPRPLEQALHAKNRIPAYNIGSQVCPVEVYVIERIVCVCMCGADE